MPAWWRHRASLPPVDAERELSGFVRSTHEGKYQKDTGRKLLLKHDYKSAGERLTVCFKADFSFSSLAGLDYVLNTSDTVVNAGAHFAGKTCSPLLFFWHSLIYWKFFIQQISVPNIKVKRFPLRDKRERKPLNEYVCKWRLWGRRRFFLVKMQSPCTQSKKNVDEQFKLLLHSSGLFWHSECSFTFSRNTDRNH